jgi:protein-L-isoaspartate(D-aspartate) O-methyltransferase
MFTHAELALIRRAYAKQITRLHPSPQVEAAFARVPREDFLGPGPWPIFMGMGVYLPTPAPDPVYLYADNLVGLITDRHINNGQPSYHAHLLACAKPAEGEHAVHIGTGTGYYTAIMAEMVGSSGRVTGIEFEPELADRACGCLSKYSNVKVLQGDGAIAPFDKANVIYVNAGATRPADLWLENLADGGRLILPLTTARGFSLSLDNAMAVQGSVFMITRKGDDFLAKWVSPVAIFPCAGARDETSERALAKALETGRMRDVTRLYRHNDVPPESCFLSAPDWSLAYS